MRVQSYGCVCKYCRRVFADHCSLVMHKLEYHPLEYAEEKRVKNSQKTKENGIKGLQDFVHGSNDAHASWRHAEPANTSSVVRHMNEVMTLPEVISATKENAHYVLKTLLNEATTSAQVLPSAIRSFINGHEESRLRADKASPTLSHYENTPFRNSWEKELHGNRTKALHHRQQEVAHLPFTDSQDNLADVWTCHICAQRYRTQSLLMLHMKLSHQSDTGTNHRVGDGSIPDESDHGRGLKAGKLSYSSAVASPVKIHSEGHNAERSYECYVCEESFSTPRGLTNHHRTHTKDVQYKCNDCGSLFKTEWSCINHACNANETQPPQGACGDVGNESGRHDNQTRFSPASPQADYNQDQTLRAQEENEAGNSKDSESNQDISSTQQTFKAMIECPYCNKKLTSERLFQIHLRVHSGDKPYSCAVCHAKFANVQGLATHSGSRKCGSTRGAHYLNQSPATNQPEGTNLDNQQLDDSPHETPTFYLAQDIFETYADESGGPDQEQLSSEVGKGSKIGPGKGEANMPCPRCDKKFRSGYYLTIHMRNHTGDKPYKCSECGQRFASSQSLANHRRTHPLLGFYECPQCQQIFTSERKKKAHMSKECHGPVPNPDENMENGIEAAANGSEESTVQDVGNEAQDLGQNEDKGSDCTNAEWLKEDELLRPDVVLIDESSLTPLQKHPPAQWVIADRLREIDLRPISLVQAEHAASALEMDFIPAFSDNMDASEQSDSSATPWHSSDEDKQTTSDPNLGFWNDHCYTIMNYDTYVIPSDGRKLWEKARKNVTNITSKAKTEELPSHQCSKCHAFFTEEALNLHGCKQSPAGSRRNSDTPTSGKTDIKDPTTSVDMESAPHTDTDTQQYSTYSKWDGKRLKKLRRTQILKRKNRLHDQRNHNGGHKGFGKLKCPLCETHFRKSPTIQCHLSTYHRVSMSCQRALGFDPSVPKNGNALTRLKSLADNMKHCIGQIVKAAESQNGIRAKFRRVGRSNSFEMDIDP